MLHKITKRPPFKDTEASYEAINDAIVEHSRWLADWNKCILCGELVPDLYLITDSTRCCGFGKWYYGKHASFLDGLQEFVDIKQLHIEVHNRVRNISSKVNSRDAVTHEDYNAFLESEKLFSKAVVQLRDELYSLLFCFDFLTGTLTRQAFLDVIGREHARISRTSDPCSIALLDIDYFKAVNDRYGHPTGDRVLVHIANLLNSHLRLYDSVGRYGGEEFLICLPNTETPHAYNILDRLREDIAQHEITTPECGAIKITASIGIAAMRAEHDLNVSIDHADKALYRAKKCGRDNVETWTD